jgi:hypothetical protein
LQRLFRGEKKSNKRNDFAPKTAERELKEKLLPLKRNLIHSELLEGVEIAQRLKKKNRRRKTSQ